MNCSDALDYTGPQETYDQVRYYKFKMGMPARFITYPLSEIQQAQEDFLAKKHVGKLVLIPPA